MFPKDADLRRLINFSAEDGGIWLADERMVLMHASSMGLLRRELFTTLGRARTRRLFMRAGFGAGRRAATLARRLRGNASLFDRFAVGPQFQMLAGAGQMTMEQLELDVDAGRFLGIFRVSHSWEVDTLAGEPGAQDSPVCWMLQGYASGYASKFMGAPVLFKEVACRACGDAHCRFEGRPQADWPDGEELARDHGLGSAPGVHGDLPSAVETLPPTLSPVDPRGPLIGRSSAFEAATNLLRKAAGTEITVLLTGETGVGKERFARALHAMSARADKPFVALNCAALPESLIESELFGAERGAFTGATATRPGRFERADGGTLMLDELGELPLAAQAKLLRVLQYGEVERLGSSQTIRVDVRVIAATHVDLMAAVEAGRFRRDLMYRLNVYPIRIPPLRERVEDIEPLALYLLDRFTSLHRKRIDGFTDKALQAMRAHGWAGNVRELENLIERGVILTEPGEPMDTPALFPGHENAGDASAQVESAAGFGEQVYDSMVAGGLSLDALQTLMIQQAVQRADGNLAAAARALGITRPQLSYRLRTRSTPAS